jgi:hypothetical protein
MKRPLHVAFAETPCGWAKPARSGEQPLGTYALCPCDKRNKDRTITVSGCFLNSAIDHSPREGTKKARPRNAVIVDRMSQNFLSGAAMVGWHAGRYKLEDVQLNPFVQESDGFGVATPNRFRRFRQQNEM